MALFRNVNLDFWTDTKVVDDFTPEDKYFMLYCLTNQYTNIIGCYEISIKQMSIDLGYTKEVVEKLLNRFKEVHKIVFYDYDTKELLVKNWSKYNWNNSPKIFTSLFKNIEKVKSNSFHDYLANIYNSIEKTTTSPNIDLRGIDTLWIPYLYHIDTTITITNTIDNNINNNTNNNNNIDNYNYNNKDNNTIINNKYNNNTSNNIYSNNNNNNDNNNNSNVNERQELVKVVNDLVKDEELKGLIVEFIKMRKLMKKPLTEFALKRCINKLSKLSVNISKQKEIVIQSITNGWLDFYELKSTQTKTKNESFSDYYQFSEEF